MSWDKKFSTDAGAIKASEIRELLKILSDPSILSFAGGIPDPAYFPMAQVKDIISGLESRPDLNRQAMQYSLSEGYEPLRTWVSETSSTAEISLGIDNILITNGAQQSLTLLAAALIDVDSPIAVADPTYLGALQVFGTRRPRFVSIETDADGLRMESLEDAFKKGVKLLYTIPDFQNPGGMTIPEERRQRIVELAHRYDVVILEDTAYRALYYDRPPPPSLLEIEGRTLGTAQWHTKGLVIQLGTVSKTLMPALRVGWTIAPQALLDKLVLLKQANDLHTSTFNQIIAHELATGILTDHTIKLREIYRKRRDAMTTALRQHLPNSSRFSAPQGGMFVWLTLPAGMDARNLLKSALNEEKIAFVPGAAFYANGGGENTLRLSFSTCSPETIDEGMKRLSALIAREYLAMISSQ